MERLQTATKTSTLQEWSNFLSVLNEGRHSNSPLLKKSETAESLIMHLEKQFSKVEQQPIFRRLGKHTQLVLRFS